MNLNGKTMKNIEFSDVIKFIYKAMDNNLFIDLRSTGMCIAHSKEYTDNYGATHWRNCIEFGYNGYEENNKLLRIFVGGWLGSTYLIETTNNKDIALWQLLIEDVKDYINRGIEEKFNNFFKEDNKSIDINDLDDEEE